MFRRRANEDEGGSCGRSGSFGDVTSARGEKGMVLVGINKYIKPLLGGVNHKLGEARAHSIVARVNGHRSGADRACQERKPDALSDEPAFSNSCTNYCHMSKSYHPLNDSTDKSCRCIDGRRVVPQDLPSHQALWRWTSMARSGYVLALRCAFSVGRSS